MAAIGDFGCRASLPSASLRRYFSRGTGSSNPSPSSRQSVSRPHPLSNVENPGFPRGCARLASRPGRQRRAGCFDIARTGANISVGPYSSMFSPLAIMAGKVGILANGPAMSLLRGTEGSIRLPPAGRQVRNPTVTRLRATFHATTPVSIAARRVLCTGTLIDPSRVLTVPHCVYNPTPSTTFCQRLLAGRCIDRRLYVLRGRIHSAARSNCSEI